MIGYLWLIPLLPLLAAGLIAVSPARYRRLSAGSCIASLAGAAALSIFALAQVAGSSVGGEAATRAVYKFRWLQLGNQWLELGWVLDPLSGLLLVMVSVIALLVVFYSVSYMDQDPNFTRFFGFVSLFSAAMLGLVIANSLLLLFICWEIVGLTSYLLIGFWYHKPAAAAAAKKAFITTRVGDLALLIGMVWLYSETGTLLFYDQGAGCLEAPALSGLISRGTVLGISVSTAIGLLIFAGAVGKSGQVPLHVWLPDAMEGPTPVSALIHAATMVAAGVFLVGRVYPLLAAHAPWEPAQTGALTTIAWVGVITALFAALTAVAQTDIKRILAYSTVSQLGFMMLGLATGGIAVGIFHLLTHACFKALLFLGAGSVIHGCHGEQDIRNMGGLRKWMPVTFATYAIGMLALSGFPLFFSGFWSKDAILHAAEAWPVSRWPFYLGTAAAFLTAFYMTRQMCFVFFNSGNAPHTAAHESPRLMTVPLLALAAGAILLGVLGTPAWPWFEAFLEGHKADLYPARLLRAEFLQTAAISTALVIAGLATGWLFYGRRPVRREEPDPLEQRWPTVFSILRRKFFVDETYAVTVVTWQRQWGRACDALDRWGFGLAVRMLTLAVVGFAWVSRALDEWVFRGGFDRVCEGLRTNGKRLAWVQNGQAQVYLRILAGAVAVLGILLLWGCHR